LAKGERNLRTFGRPAGYAFQGLFPFLPPAGGGRRKGGREKERWKGEPSINQDFVFARRRRPEASG